MDFIIVFLFLISIADYPYGFAEIIHFYPRSGQYSDYTGKIMDSKTFPFTGNDIIIKFMNHSGIISVFFNIPVHRK